MIGIAGEFGRFAMQRVAGEADDAEQARRPAAAALLRPIEGRALRVGIDQCDALSASRPFAGEMQRQRGLADAALLVEERDNYRSLLRREGPEGGALSPERASK